MNIAELFVNLGVKGSEKTVGALDGINKGLKNTASMSLEAKAAIVGAMYALERLFAASGQTGTGLTNFNALIGVSARTLQQYEYAARQMGISNQEVEGSFKSLQTQMTKTLMGEGAPKGMARVAMLTGGMTAQDVLKFQQSPEQLIQKLQEYADKEQNAGLRTEVLKSFGLGDNMIAALNRQAFKPKVLAKAPTYSDKEVGALDKANIAWSNLGNKIEMAFGHFNAAHGGQIVGDISKIVDKVIELSNAFVKLAEKAELFKWIGKVFEGWLEIFSGLTKAIEYFNEASGKTDISKLGSTEGEKGFVQTATQPTTEDKEVAESIASFFGKMFLGVASPVESSPSTKTKTTGKTIEPKTAGERQLKIVPTPTPLMPTSKSIEPPIAAATPAAPSQNISVNQNLNFQHDGKDAVKTGDSTKRAVKDAFRQLSAQAQGS